MAERLDSAGCYNRSISEAAAPQQAFGKCQQAVRTDAARARNPCLHGRSVAPLIVA